MSNLDDYGAEPQGAEAELRRRLRNHDFLVDRFQLAEQMRVFIETPAGAYLYATLKDDANDSIKALLDQPTPDTDTAKAYFARAKTAWAALLVIQETLAMGPEAERLMIEMDEST